MESSQLNIKAHSTCLWQHGKCSKWIPWCHSEWTLRLTLLKLIACYIGFLVHFRFGKEILGLKHWDDVEQSPVASETVLPPLSLCQPDWKAMLIWELCCTQNPTISFSWAPSLLVAKRNYTGHLVQGFSADGNLIMFPAAALFLKRCALHAVWWLACLYAQIRGESVGNLLCLYVWEQSCKVWYFYAWNWLYLFFFNRVITLNQFLEL